MATTIGIQELAKKTFDARTNPEETASASAAFLAAAHRDAMPSIDSPDETHVTLDRGILRDGTWHRDAEVRELTGADEEALARAGTNWPRVVDTLLTRGVRTVGSEAMTRALADELILGDRETLILAIRRVSFGDSISYERVPCPGCGDRIDVTFPLSEIPLVHLDDPEAAEFPVPLRHQRTAYLRLPTGADQSVVLGLKDATVAQQNTEMIGRCLIRVDGPDGEQAGSARVARDLPMADRHAIVARLAELQPGPRYSDTTFAHDVCGEEVPLPIGLGDLFR